MADGWYCKIAGKTSGPHSAAELKALASQGRISASDLVKQDGKGAWVPAGRVKGLFPSADANGIGAGPQGKSTSPSAVPVAKAVEEAGPPGGSKALRKAKPLEQPPVVSPPKAPIEPAIPVTGGHIPVATAVVPGQPAPAPAVAPAPPGPYSPPVAVPQPPAPSGLAPSAGINIVTEGSPPASGDPGGDEGEHPVPRRKRRNNTALFVVLAVALVGGAAVGGGIWLSSMPAGDETASGRGSDSDKAASEAEDSASGHKLDMGVVDAVESGKPVEPERSDHSQASAAGSVPATSQAPAGEDEWVDAVDGSITRGDITVKIVSAAVGQPEVRGSDRTLRLKNRYLMVRVELSNGHATKKRNHEGWGGRSRASYLVNLVDDFDNEYTLVSQRLAMQVVGQGNDESIYPNDSLEDVLVFEPPIEKASYLRLLLPASAFDEPGLLKFHIPMAMIEELPEPEPPRQPDRVLQGAVDMERASADPDNPIPDPPGREVEAIRRGIEEMEAEEDAGGPIPIPGVTGEGGGEGDDKELPDLDDPELKERTEQMQRQLDEEREKKRREKFRQGRR